MSVDEDNIFFSLGQMRLSPIWLPDNSLTSSQVLRSNDLLIKDFPPFEKLFPL